MHFTVTTKYGQIFSVFGKRKKKKKGLSILMQKDSREQKDYIPGLCVMSRRIMAGATGLPTFVLQSFC